MISLEELRKIDPKLKDRTDVELTEIRNLLYGLAKVSMESFFEGKSGSKLTFGVYGLHNDDM